MLFLAITDSGALTQPIEAASLEDAADQLKLLYGAGLGGDGQTPVRITIVLPQAIATIIPNRDPSRATIQLGPEAQNQKTIRSNARTALANNAAYLALPSPTQAQAAAQVAALTRQVNGLIRMLIGDFGAVT